MSSTTARRLRTISTVVAALMVVTALAPILLIVAVAVDAGRSLAGRPWMSVRGLAFLWVFLAAETAGLVVAGLQWLGSGLGRNRRLLERWSYRLQVAWAMALWQAIEKLFRLSVVVEGEENVAPGPVVCFFRHASIVDNLLPAVLVTARHGIRLRWVVKRELLSDPALDVVGNRLPTYFVERASSDPAAEIANIAALAEGMGPTDGVLLFPEGTRFTPAKQDRALARLAAADSALHARAQRLRHLLPPRLGGALAVLDAGADVLLCFHHGLDGFAHVGDIWGGGLVGREVRVRFTRVSASAIPPDREGRVAWLYDQWQAGDDWIGAAG